MKILISWIALKNDFTETNTVNTNGPNYRFHKYHFKHDKHVLLYSHTTHNQAICLEKTLKQDFAKHKVEIKPIHIEEIHDLNLVKTKTEQILAELKEHEIDIFFSPGAPMMQISWYICHSTLGLKTNLLQLLRTEHSKDKKRGDLLNIDFEYSPVPISVLIKQSNPGNKKNESDFLMTPSIKPVYEKADKISQTDNVSVLIYGETGTGKEHLAQYIHNQSFRKNKNFEAINCAGMSDSLLESRLFGHQKGSFTGAIKTEPGIFKKADGGTVFLDEIADITPYMQQSLLRVLQEKEIMPVGGNRQKIDVRIIAATNKNLIESVSAGNFRSDLYYRLAVAELELPNLVQRGIKEKQLLIKHFLEIKHVKFGRVNILEFDKELIKFLNSYTFPGNIRELENLIERFYVFCEKEVKISETPAYMRSLDYSSPVELKEVEKNHILKIYKFNKGNKKQTAIALGISLNTLKTKLESYQTEEDK